MEKLSERKRILLGYTHRDPFGTLPNPSHRNSDVDFHDVFGGPPRRSSINESRRGRVDSLDSRSWRESGSGSGEKPVFGEISSPARRWHLKDDFFSDIFQSSDSSCSSLSKPDRDVFPTSSPGSRILSPTRSVPPQRCEPVIGGSSPQAQLSLSMKLAKGMEHPTFSSPIHRALYKNEDGAPDAFSFPSSPNAFVPSFTNQAVLAQDDLKIDSHALYRQSPLSRQISHSLDRSLEATDSASLSIGSHSQKDPTSLESYASSGLFHFSIYKWAGKGVTLIMPSNTNLRNKYESRFRRLPEVVLQEVDLTLCKDNMSATTKASKSQSESQDDESPKDLIIESKDGADSTIVKDLLPAELESKFLHSDVTKNLDTCNSNSKEVPVTMHEAQKHELKHFHQLFDDDLDKKRNEDIIRQIKETEGLPRGQQSVYDDINIKQQAGRENKSDPFELISPNTRDAPLSLEEKMHGSRVKGKVKDFIKIFNQEVLPKRKGTFGTLDKRSRGKDRGKGEVEDKVSASAAKADKQVKATSRNNNSALPHTPIPINQNLEKSEKANSDTSDDVHMITDFLSERNDPLGPCSDSTSDILDASVCNIEESHCEGLEECLVEQLSQYQHKHIQPDSLQDQIKIMDAKIREWSKGKEGNIRSLLSTLQYVLWPESGWKPVPLVDIIEGTSVKRVYQKALLCLHPDKLQQKGAATHQKYIAEKVFDILQEAWIQFNSVSQF